MTFTMVLFTVSSFRMLTTASAFFKSIFHNLTRYSLIGQNINVWNIFYTTLSLSWFTLSNIFWTVVFLKESELRPKKRQAAWFALRICAFDMSILLHEEAVTDPDGLWRTQRYFYLIIILLARNLIAFCMLLGRNRAGSRLGGVGSFKVADDKWVLRCARGPRGGVSREEDLW